MKIRRFKNNPDQLPWKRWAYVEYQEGKLFFQGLDGGFGPAEPWNLAEAEKLVEKGLWIELKPDHHTQFLGDWPEDWAHENGCYGNICSICQARFLAHKRRVTCKVCHRNGVTSIEQTEIQPYTGPASVTVDTATPPIPTIRSMKLYEFFQEFRYAKVTAQGMGDTYNRATAFIDAEIRDRITTILKGMK